MEMVGESPLVTVAMPEGIIRTTVNSDEIETPKLPLLPFCGGQLDEYPKDTPPRIVGKKSGRFQLTPGWGPQP